MRNINLTDDELLIYSEIFKKLDKKETISSKEKKFLKTMKIKYSKKK